MSWLQPSQQVKTPVRRLTGFLEPVCLMSRWDALTVFVMIATNGKLIMHRTRRTRAQEVKNSQKQHDKKNIWRTWFSLGEQQFWDGWVLQ